MTKTPASLARSASHTPTFTRVTSLGRGGVFCAFGVAAVLAACAASDEDLATVTPSAASTVVTRSGQALVIDGQAATFQAINGTYGASCVGRSGSWSTAVGSFSGALANPALSVVKNDSACTLTLASLAINGRTYTPSTPLALGASFAGSPLGFTTTGSPFYANAKLTPADFSGPFAIELVVSDDPGALTGAVTASYSTVASSGSAAVNPAPDYTLATAGVTVAADANNVVQSVAGDLVLTVGSVGGDAYVAYAGSLDPTSSAAVKAAYEAGTETAITSSPFAVAASALTLTVGSTVLPQTRYIIVRHTSNAVSTYEVVAVTFNAPVAYTYAWSTGSFGSCSVSCGGGTQTRPVTCRRSDSTTVADSFCTDSKPATTQSCNTSSCTTGSCVGHCGGFSQDFSCDCDDMCILFGSCCADFYAVCV